MEYLILSILGATTLSFVFKGFERYGINNLHAIVVNYFVCVCCASLALGDFPIKENFWEAAWFPYALGLGFVFISGFLVTAMTVQKFGVTIGAIMQKMSIVISVSMAFYLYQESVTLFKILGILLALLAIILTNIPHDGNPVFKEKMSLKLFFLPFYTWLSMGIIEVVLQYVELKVSTESGDLAFVAFLFATAGILGLIIIALGGLFKGFKFEWKNVLGGIALGIPNFASIYFLMKTLGIGWEGSVIFPINNVAIIILSIFLAVVFLKEKLSKLNMLGVLCAALSILLIALA